MIRLARPDIGENELASVRAVLESGMLVHGSKCADFEERLAALVGTKHALVVSSCTAALHLSLLALKIGPGDAVIIPDFTFPATANVVEAVGARPIFVDVSRGTYNLTAEGLAAAVERWPGPEEISAVMPVHQFGCPVDMPSLMEVTRPLGLSVIEDAACAIGSTSDGVSVGSYGDCACFSFHPRKVITTGEGGAIVTSDDELSHTLRLIRNHGQQSSGTAYDFVMPGLNFRMTEFQAACGSVQLERLESLVSAREALANVYNRLLSDSDITLPSEVPGQVWQTYMVVLPQGCSRDTVIREMRNRGIETNRGAYSVHSLSYYRQKYPHYTTLLSGSVSERLDRYGLALPLHTQMSTADAETVATELLSLVAEVVHQ